MKKDNNSFVQFEEKGAPITIRHNMQQPGSYFGRAFMELNFGDRGKNYFKAECYHTQKQESPEWAQKGVTPSLISILLEKARRPELRVQVSKSVPKSLSIPSIKTEEMPEVEALSNMNMTDWWTIGVHNLSKRLQNIDLAELEAEAGKLGYKTIWYRNHSGALDFYLLNTEYQSITPHLYLIESYRLSTYPMQYGTGRTIKNVTLVPGEKTRISIATYKKSNDENIGSCILDSNTPESVQEFQNCIESENQGKHEYFTTMGFFSSTEVDQPLFSCNVPIENTMHLRMARQEFVKNLWKSVTKHCNRAASKRFININSETSPENNTQRSVIREITNPNPGKTVNYLFRQLNQEYLTILHLNDIRIGYTNGIFYKEYTLPELNTMLNNVVFPDMHNEIRTHIMNAIMDIRDYNNESIRDRDIIQIHPDPDSATKEKYIQFNSFFESTYKDTTGNEFCVPGIIMSMNRFVMPTESVIIDTMLGQGDMLDLHIREMQNEELRERVLNNDMKEREVERLTLAESIVRDTIPEKAKIFEEVFAKFDNGNWG